MWRLASRGLARGYAALASAPPVVQAPRCPSSSTAAAAIAAGAASASSPSPPLLLSFRSFTSSAVPRRAVPPQGSVEARKEARRAAEAANALAATGGAGGREVTDQIPVRPVGVVEGASYTVVIVAGVACAGEWEFMDDAQGNERVHV